MHACQHLVDIDLFMDDLNLIFEGESCIRCWISSSKTPRQRRMSFNLGNCFAAAKSASMPLLWNCALVQGAEATSTLISESSGSGVQVKRLVSMPGGMR
jgi:hypothetical protein